MKQLRVTCGVWLVLGGLTVTAMYGQRASTPRPAATTVLRFQAPSFLGVAVMDVDSERAKALGLKEERGVEVKSVEDDSPAAKAGIKEGDVVLEYNGQRVDGTEQFMRLVRETPAGRQAKVTVWRGGATQTLTATIGSRTGQHFDRDSFAIAIPRPPEIRLDLPRPFTSWRSSTLGIESESLGSQLAEYFGVKEGALVRAVTKGSAADKG
ncbi:MAG: PDZ domain-containing protein, partial [Bryobacteraceae bacterium]